MADQATNSAQTVLVTGASAGIGADIARSFAKRGCQVVLVARSRDKLEALAGELQAAHGTAVTVLPMDLARAGSAQDLLEAVTNQGLVVDILVNNAGVIQVGPFTDLDPAGANNLVQLNLGTLAATTRAFLDPMLARGRGRVLNVASVAAYQPIPGLALYAASKAAVLAFGEALGEELRGTGVTVTTLCPGMTDTAMIDSAAGVLPEPPAGLISDPAAVAEEGVEACLLPGPLHCITRGRTCVTKAPGSAGRFCLQRRRARYAMQWPGQQAHIQEARHR